MTFKEALNKGILLLESEDILDAKIDAWLLLSFVSGITKAQYFLKQNEEIPENTLYKYKEVLLRRASHVPLQHITGEQDFMGLTFWVNEHVLIPRQDTETLVEEALKVIPSGSHVLDLCTGSGCVIISLVALGQGLSGIGVDISEDALVLPEKTVHVSSVKRLLLKRAIYLLVSRADLMLSFLIHHTSQQQLLRSLL